MLSLALGLPASELFPTAPLGDAIAGALAGDPRALQYGPPSDELRTFVAELMLRRGVRCAPEQVFLTAGAQQGMSLLARLLVEPGAGVMLEDHAYTGFVQAVAPSEPRLVTVPGSPASGIDLDAVEAALARGPRPALLYAMSDGHNPLGVSMPLAARRRLAGLARAYEVPVLEDDAYGMISYDDEEMPALRAFDDEWVLYLGSFSKTLAPALRTGWVVVPERFLGPLASLKESTDIDTATLGQRAVAAFVAGGSFAGHVARLRREYGARRDAMLAAVARELPPGTRWSRPRAGFFTWVELEGGVDTSRLFEEALARERVAFVPGAAFTVAGAEPARSALRLNFSYSRPEVIEEGVRRIARALAAIAPAARPARPPLPPLPKSVGARGAAATVALGYGRSSVPMVLDPERFDLLAPAQHGEAELSDAELLARIDDPIGSDRLEALVSARDRVLIVVPDATRASASDRVVAALLRKLRARGVADERIGILVGGGTHRAPTPAEIDRIVGAEAARRVAVFDHDAYDRSAIAGLGTTSRGTPVEVNRRLVEADRVILVGAIGLHYFAGFSGGRKGFLPGCGSDRAIQTNHLLGFDRATLSRAAGIGSGLLDGNPVSEDMEEATRLFGPTFLVNAVLGPGNRIVAGYAGDWFAAHRKGCADYLAAHSVPAAERRPLVVASCGGTPRDLNMIQSHKALEHARVVLEEGGDLILLAECTEGLGRDDFLDWFVPGGARATARKLVEGYRIFGQTAWGIRWKSELYRVRLVSSLAPAVVRTMGMIPHASLAEALAEAGPKRGYVIPNGLGTLPVLAEAARGGAGAGT